jgi:plasmid stabilization system protein ParE
VKPLVLDDAARDEYREAADDYLAANPGVGRRFIERVEEALGRIHAEPHVWPLAPHIPEYLGIRKRRIDGFPHSVVYLEMPNEVRILAVAHGRRKPGYWLRRLGR